ncbi:MAG: hypothetical protein E6G08_06310 [Actinobacteria bacterium]|nr:MAG: hypothetical protein E6G08_06310 [Actinomycetota bacterium]
MRRLLLLVPLALLAAACGQTAAKPFAAGPTASCLRTKGFQVSTKDADIGLVASTAANGGLLATPKGGGNTLVLAFAADGKGAGSIEGAFRRFAPKKLRPHLGDVMSAKRNAVLLWTVSPTAEQQATVLACLRS